MSFNIGQHESSNSSSNSDDDDTLRTSSSSSSFESLQEEPRVPRRKERDETRSLKQDVNDKWHPKEHYQKKRSQRGRSLVLSATILFVGILCSYMFPLSDSQCGAGPNSIYVPGGGFSGFWFTLGRLKSVMNPYDKEYFCFSAGCLAVVATLKNYTAEEMLCVALGSQQEWKSGQISRYDVVPTFIDSLIYDTEQDSELLHVHYNFQNNSSSRNNDKNNFKNDDYNSNHNFCLSTGPTRITPNRKLSEMLSSRCIETKRGDDLLTTELLSRIHIITSTRSTNSWGGLKAATRTPQTKVELREMLLQTTWIPYAVGNGMWHKGHMDGGATFIQHPRCEASTLLPYEMDLILNIINVNLGYQKAMKFWNSGLDYGL